MRARSLCLCSLVLFACGSDDDAPPSDAGADAGLCSEHSECDDGVFCNGEEQCDPEAASADGMGCVAGEAPCLEGQTCDEDADECVTSCELSGDADGDGEPATECGGADCDDSDPARAPGNAEVCDPDDVDEDCDDSTFGERDMDSDGLVDAMCCNGETCGRDCDDSRPGVGPDSPEVCDQRDNDCDGNVDEGLLVARYPDLDADGHGASGSSMMMVCPGTSRVAQTNDDCDDADAAVYAEAAEVCDSKDNDCDGTMDEAALAVTWYQDSDGDGFGSAAGGTMIACAQPDGYALLPFDCDDDDADVSPAAVEQCNGRDDDCNGLADYRIAEGDTEDDDRDGIADSACDEGTDCNDESPFSETGSPEVCDGADNDCDGNIDEDASSQSWYPDIDRDGFGSATATAIESCEPPPRHVLNNTDCDDTNASTFPGARELCDGIDNDCDESLEDEGSQIAVYTDDDGDGYGDGMAQMIVCGAGAGTSVLPGDCEDDDSSIFPGADEVCDGVDQDCDMSTDEGVLTTFYRDVDLDGYGRAADGTTEACSAPDTYSALDGDCMPMNRDAYPGAIDICDSLENDCDAAAADPIDDAAPELVCSQYPEVATGLCISGNCIIQTCEGDFEDCNASADDGCEVDLMSDDGNCGNCGIACVAGAECSEGSCQGDIVQLLAVRTTLGADGFVALRDNGAVAYWGNLASQSTVTTSAATIDLFPAEALGLAAMAEVPDDVDVLWTYYRNFCARSFSHGGWLCSNATPPQSTIPAVDILDLAMEDGHGCLIRTNGQVYCWGNNDYGQLGIGSTTPAPDPVLVPGATNAVQVVVAGPNRDISCYRNASGEVYCMGFGPNTGTDNTTDVLSPIQVTLPSPAVDIAMTEDLRSPTTCAALENGQAWCWGGYSFNPPHPIFATGNPASPQSVVPVQVVAPQGTAGFLMGAVDLTGGERSMCALLNTGTAVCWGDDSQGVLGNGSTLGSGQVPQYIVTDDAGTWLTDIEQIAIGNLNACALRTDDSAYCWGYNNLGDAGNPMTPVPAQFAYPVANLP